MSSPGWMFLRPNMLSVQPVSQGGGGATTQSSFASPSSCALTSALRKKEKKIRICLLGFRYVLQYLQKYFVDRVTPNKHHP